MWTWARQKAHKVGAVDVAAPVSDVRVEPVAPCSRCAELPATIDTSLTQYRERVHECIQYAQALSEKEIMAIAESVQDIVSHTGQYIEESKHAVEKNVVEQTQSLDDYLAGAKQTAEAQGAAVKQALTLSDDIARAGAAVDKLASQARLLALNAKIEAARLGSSGSAFGVITEQMTHLSTEIAKTNRLIADATEATRTCLPVITAQTSLQIQRLEEFTHAMHQFKQGVEQSMSATNSAADSHIHMILELAHAALSHLQFQDPMIQSVQKVDFLMRDLHNEVNMELGIPAPTKTSSAYVETIGSKISEAASDTTVAPPPSGEVLLF